MILTPPGHLLHNTPLGTIISLGVDHCFAAIAQYFNDRSIKWLPRFYHNIDIG